MDIGDFGDSIVTIILGTAFLFAREFRRSRRVLLPVCLIGYGVVMIVVHSPMMPGPIATSSPSVAWQIIRSTDGVLAVSMPEKPVPQTSNSQAESLSIRTVKHSTSINNGEFIFSLVEMHLENNDLEYDPKECVAAIAQDTLSKSHGTLIGEKTIRLGPHEGKEMKIQMGDYVVVMHLFFVGKCAYQIKLTIPKGQLNSPLLSRYFDSLSFKPLDPI